MPISDYLRLSPRATGYSSLILAKRTPFGVSDSSTLESRLIFYPADEDK